MRDWRLATGVMAALLAKGGMTASEKAIDGPQGYLHALDSEGEDLDREIADLGRRWEMLDTGITVKLYPSCAGTHPTLDAILDLRAEHGFTSDDVDRIDVDVDPIVPTILIYDRPASALEAKFSLPFCAAAACVFGHVGIGTFDDAALQDARVGSLMSAVSMKVDDEIGRGKPSLTEARVRIALKDGRTLEKEAHGARGYPANPPSAEDRQGKIPGLRVARDGSRSRPRALRAAGRAGVGRYGQSTGELVPRHGAALHFFADLDQSRAHRPRCWRNIRAS
jgi:2-methylcitrate dehydratase PrpD